MSSHEQAIVAFARDLVAIPTENPPGAAYDACVERIAAELDALGLEYEVVDTGDGSVRRRSILASAGDGGRLLYLHGHYDVVPAFTREQFEPRVADGRLVGRGSSDMKGGLASIVYGALEAAERGARVGLVIVPDEETGGRLGSERLAALGRLDAGAAGAIVAEPTWGTIWHACRGAFTLEVTVRGRAAHVGLHYEGRSAFDDAVGLVGELGPLRDALRERRSELGFASTDPRAAESILLVGGLAQGGTGFNIVPDRFTFTLDRRPNPEEDYDTAKRELVGVLEAAAEPRDRARVGRPPGRAERDRARGRAAGACARGSRGDHDRLPADRHVLPGRPRDPRVRRARDPGRRLRAGPDREDARAGRGRPDRESRRRGEDLRRCGVRVT